MLCDNLPGGLGATTGEEVSWMGIRCSYTSTRPLSPVVCTHSWFRGHPLWNIQYLAASHQQPCCHQEQTTGPGHSDYAKAINCLLAPVLTPYDSERNPVNTKSDYVISLLKTLHSFPGDTE